MLTLPISDVAPFIPQSGEMVLLDCITDFGEDFLTAETTICPNNCLIKNGKFDTFAAIEILAQGIAAWAGVQAKQQNQPVRLGYLLGTRKLHIAQPEIPIGSRLQIRVKMSIQDATGVGVFDCELIDLATKNCLLSGALNVFSPKDGKIQK